MKKENLARHEQLFPNSCKKFSMQWQFHMTNCLEMFHIFSKSIVRTSHRILAELCSTKINKVTTKLIIKDSNGTWMRLEWDSNETQIILKYDDKMMEDEEYRQRYREKEED